MTEVRDNPRAHRFEILLDSEIVGFTDYVDDGEVRTFPHTKVYDAFAGQGLASRLIRTALDQTRAAGMRVRPSCPFVKDFIARHPDYADLVAGSSDGQ